MQTYWQQGDATAAEARDRLAAVGSTAAYVTVANLVRTLSDKGFLQQINEERPLYVPRRQVLRRSLAQLGTGPCCPGIPRLARDWSLDVLKRRRLTTKERTLLREILEEQES